MWHWKRYMKYWYTCKSLLTGFSIVLGYTISKMFPFSFCAVSPVSVQPGSSWNDLAHYLKICWLWLQTQKERDLKWPEFDFLFLQITIVIASFLPSGINLISILATFCRYLKPRREKQREFPKAPHTWMTTELTVLFFLAGFPFIGFCLSVFS